MELELKAANANDFDVAWSLFSKFARDHMFGGTPGRKKPDEWNETDEKYKFESIWKGDNNFSIRVDDKCVGWANINKTKSHVSIENWHLSKEWQDHKITSIILGELVPKWRSEGLIIEASVLKDQPMTDVTAKILTDLGFVHAEEQAHANVMRTNQEE